MKTTKKFLIGIAVLAVVFSMSACDSGGGGGSGIGTALNISGQQVYQMDMYGDTTAYNGDQTVNSNIGYSGKIEGGKFTFSAGTPVVMDPVGTLLLNIGMDEMYNNPGCNPNNAQGIELELYTNAGGLSKVNASLSTNSFSQEIIAYIYVDMDCTVTGNGKTINIEGIPVTSSNLNLNLKAGWNAVKMNVSASMSSMSGTVKVSLGDSNSSKWVLGDNNF